MNDRNLVIDTLQHRQREAVPYQLDLTEEMRAKVDQELGPDFLTAVENCFAIDGDGKFENLNVHRRKDQFGAIWLLDQKGDFGVVENNLLPEPSCDSYTFPEPDETAIRETCRKLVSSIDKGKFAMFTIGFSLFERAWTLRGMENILADMVLNPAFLDELMERITAYNLAVIDIVLEYPVDALFFGDDWGQQKGLIMGPGYWRRFIKPGLAKMYRRVKEGGKYICQHSCGDVQEVFPDLIDLGLDIYNTFQPEIYDVQAVKKMYGSNLTFYGGISTQRVLPFGTAAEVRNETRQMMQIVGNGGGYVVAPTHAMPPDIPVENMLAFLEAVQAQYLDNYRISPHNRTMKQWYEKLFENYGEKYDQEPFTQGTMGECDFIENEIGRNRDLKILDIGCGTGRHAIELTRRGYSVTGVDLSEGQLQRARKKAADAGLSIPFQRQDARSLPFRQEFDVAVMLCEGGFPLMETDEMNFQILKSAAAALRPGGRLIFTTLNGLFPLFHSVKDFLNSNQEAGSIASYSDFSFDLMTFRETSTIEIEDDSGNINRMVTSERYYVPSEITWLLKSLGFTEIAIFGARLGEFSRQHTLTTEDYEMLVTALRPS